MVKKKPKAKENKMRTKNSTLRSGKQSTDANIEAEGLLGVHIISSKDMRRHFCPSEIKKKPDDSSKDSE